MPFRLLDRQWVLHVAGRGPLLNEPALAVSAACRTSTPLYMSREDGYALTHAVMYATDFGAQSCPPALQSDELWATTDACLAWCLGSADYDLVAELLLTQLLLRRRLSAYGLIAWRCCTAAWDQLGFLPSPSLAPDTFEGLTSHSEGVQYAFHHMYHTIFVAGLLCNALLSLDVLPPEPLPAPLRTHPEAGAVARGIDRGLTRLGRLLSLDVDAARELTTELSWVADDGRRTAWAGEWGAAARRPGAARPADRAVRAMATDALMLAGARSFELSEVAAALRHAARDGLTPSAWVSAAFLARQEVFRAPPDGAYEDGMRIAGVLAAFTSCLVAVHDQSITESEDESRGPSAA